MTTKSLQMLMDNIYDTCMYDRNGVKRSPEEINLLLSKYVGSLESLLILFMNEEYKDQILFNLVNKLGDIDATPSSGIQQPEVDEEEGGFY